MTSPKFKYWLCIVAAFLCSTVPPVTVILQKFPVWAGDIPPANTVGAGVVFALATFVICFRKTIIPTVMDKLGIKAIPPVIVWVVVLAVAACLEKITTIITDFKVVAFAGLVGSVFGWLFTFLSAYYDKKQ